jgi:hypothetical protein
MPIDGRSLEGQFAKNLERDLLQHIGQKPTVIQRMLIRQAVRIQFQLDALNVKLLLGEFTDHDRRVFGALNNAFRLTLKDIGFDAAEAATAASRSPSLDAILDGLDDADTDEAAGGVFSSRQKPSKPPGKWSRKNRVQRAHLRSDAN